MPLRPAVVLLALCLFGLPVSGAAPVRAASTAFLPWAADAPPPLDLTDLAGVAHDLRSLRGRTVVVHFFATWCEPCIPELAALERFRSRVADARFAVVAIGVGESAGRLRRFFASRPAGFTVLPDPDRQATRAWRVEVLPATFILDEDLKPRLAVEGDVDWDKLDPAALAAPVGP